MWKIAIIDDDFQVVRGLRAAIPWDELAAEFAGEAIDGQAGLQLIREVNPDIVLTDIYMPFMNGIEMIEQLKSEGFSGRFVILSGYNDFEYARTAIRLGVDDYLTKPVTVEQIRSVLSATIEKLEETYLNRLENGQLQASDPSESEWLLSVLNGQNQIQVLPDRLKFWQNLQHVAILMEVSWTERIRGLSIADWNLFKFAVSNIVEEIMEQETCNFRFVWLFGNHAALLIQASKNLDQPAVVNDAHRIGEMIVRQMMTYLGLSLRYAVGNVKPDWGRIKESADEAMQRLFENFRAVLDVHGRSEAQAVFSLAELVQQIAGSLQKEEETEAMELFRLYLKRRAEQHHESPNPVYYSVLAAELWELLNSALQLAGITVPHRDEGHSLREMRKIASLTEIEGWLQKQIHDIRKHKAPVIHEKHRKAVQYMIEYVHNHYAEDVTLEELASKLYISKNYLNQLFKKVTGETFTNYVIRVRIEKARSLLLEGKYLIYEIAEMVGYDNVPYFSTLFKKYCGVSPSELLKK